MSCIDDDYDFARSLREYVKGDNSGGIMHIDVGYNTNSKIGWKPICRITDRRSWFIHDKVTEAYKYTHSTTPVEYLCKYVETQKHEGALMSRYSFIVSNDKKNIQCDRRDIVVNPQMADIGKEEYAELDKIFENAYSSFVNENFEIFDSELDVEKIRCFQQKFTDIIAEQYEKLYGRQVVRYSTIILFVNGSKKEKSALTHYVVIFSYDNSFLKSEEFILALTGVAYSSLTSEVNTLKEEARKESLKSAKAAIMSRNMSHNLGSHVLSYLQIRLKEDKTLLQTSKILESAQGSVLKDSGLLSDNEIDILELDEGITIQSDKNYIFVPYRTKDDYIVLDALTNKRPFINGMSQFVLYLQERQDFIATIATDFKPTLSSVSFKDFIFDELNIDHKARRHCLSSCDNILLEYIVMSEKIGRNEIKITFRNIEGLDSDEEKYVSDFEFLRRLQIDLPGGIVGRQAFFSIIENLLRNTAKHDINREGCGNAIHISIDIQKNNFKNPSYKGIRLENEYYEVSVTNRHVVATKDLVNKIKIALEEPYVSPLDSSLIENNKGLKEMRISAAWLRNEDVCEMGGNESNFLDGRPPVLSFCLDDEQHPTYYFYLRKPKKVALFTNNKDLNKDAFASFGWDIFDSTIFEVHENLLLPCSYQMYLIDKGFGHEKISPKKILSLVNKLSLKCLWLNESCIDLKEEKDFSDAYIRFYEKWCRDTFKISTLIENKIVEGLPEILVCDRGHEQEYSNYADISSKFITIKDHNDTDVQFCKFRETDIYKNSFFIEGITGSNSTDRIFRHDINIDKKRWLLHLYESSLTNILIADERLHNEKRCLDGKYFNQILYHKKRIHIITFEARKDNNRIVFDIIDIANRTIGTLFYTDKIIKLEWFPLKPIIDDNDLWGIYGHNNCGGSAFGYHFFTVHQGLLDKMREHWGVDDAMLISGFKDNIKHRRTIIHSGRGGRNEKEMTKGVGFVQWASISKSFFDCKQTLTDLLYSLSEY